MFIDKILKITADQLGHHEVRLSDHLINDLNADSLDSVELIMRLEEEFHIEINDGIMDAIHTVNDLVCCVHGIINGDKENGVDLMRLPCYA